jgi:hypothetical protein
MNRQITSQSTTLQKQQVVNAAIASVRMEGFEPTKSARDLLEKYVEGKITVNELQDKGLANAKASVKNSLAK